MRTFIIALLCLLFLSAPAFAGDFENMDANKDGKIGLQEFLGYAKERTPANLKQIDADRDGFVSEKELGGDKDFQKMDTNRDGKVSPQEGTDYIVNVLGPAKFKEADTNGDGFVDRKEYEAEQNKGLVAPPPQ